MNPTFVFEVRPLLQACSAYLASPSSEACAELVVKCEELTVTWAVNGTKLFSQSVTLPPNLPVKFQPCNVTSLTQDENHVSFRVQTAPRNLSGSFATQLVATNEKALQSFNYFCDPKVPVNVPCTIKCACCGQNILSNQSVTFRRVLPLPSYSDASDFFCHNHGNSEIDMHPHEQDYLYSTISFQLHPSLLKCQKRVIHCDECLAWIGTSSSEKTWLWNSTVDVRAVENCGKEASKRHPAHDFILVVEEAIKYSSALVCRLILDVKVNDGVTHFVLLHIIDRNLTVLTAKSNSSTELLSHQVIKVFFFSEKFCSDIVSKWLNDPLVSCIEISLPVYVHGLKHLFNTSQFIPASFRKAYNEFFCGYLCPDFV